MTGLHWTGYIAAPLALILIALLVESLRDEVRRAKFVALVAIVYSILTWIAYTVPFLVRDYTLKPVYETTSPGLPAWLLPATAWSTGGGSLLLYTVLFVVASALILQRSFNRVYAGIASVAALTTLVAAYLYGAFELNPNAVAGAGLNPLLKSIWLYPHPLTTFGGYALLAAAALALMLGMRDVRVTIIFEIGWAMLTIGIMLGGLWSYETFGWGGYWAWDPVETSELMVWLAATALPHVMLVAQFLTRAFAAFLASTVYLAMYVTRTGLSPLHSFAGAGAASVTLLLFSLLLLLYALASLALQPMPRVNLRRLSELLTPFKLSMIVASVTLSLAAVFVTGSLLAPSLLTAVGREASAPTMEAGVRFYHPVLFPLALAMLVFSPLAFIGDRLGTRGCIAYLLSSLLAIMLAWLAGHTGVVTLAPLSPRETNAMMLSGIVASMLALAPLTAYMILQLVEYVTSRRLSRYIAVAGIHLGFALVLLGVFMGGTYSFNRAYMLSYNLRPGEAIELPGGYKLVFEKYEYGITESPVDIFTPYVGRSATYALAQEALLALHYDLGSVAYGKILLERDARAKMLLSLVNRTERGIFIGNITYRGELTVIPHNVIMHNVTAPALKAENVTLRMHSVRVRFNIYPVQHGDRLVAFFTLDFYGNMINVTGINDTTLIAPSGHTIFTIGFNPPLYVKIPALNATVAIDAVMLYWYTRSGFNATVMQGRLVINGSSVRLVQPIDARIYLYLVYRDNPGFQMIMNSSLARLLLNPQKLLALVNSTDCPPVNLLELGLKVRKFCVAAPKLVPENAYLRIWFQLVAPDGSVRRIVGVLRFEVNGEVMGIHGLVSEVLHVAHGLTDVYIAVHPPLVYSNFSNYLGVHGATSAYHDLLVYYLHEVFKRLKPEERLALAALLAAGINIDSIRNISPEERPYYLELATIDLYLLAENYNVSRSPVVTEGLSIEVKLVPGTPLVWYGSLVMAAFAILSALARLIHGRSSA